MNIRKKITYCKSDKFLKPLTQTDVLLFSSTPMDTNRTEDRFDWFNITEKKKKHFQAH